MKWNKWVILSIVLFLFAAFFEANSQYLLLLTVAQVVYIPLILQVIRGKDWFSRYYPYFAIPASISVVLLHMTEQTGWDNVLAAIYLLYTCIVATYGISRFFKRGFVHFEEFSIDVGLIYLPIGGMWFFAHIANIDTGFPQIITWLTAVHFHYAAFLLPVFVGLLGRIYKPSSYHLVSGIIIISPLILAIGITFSVWIEWFSVVLYIIGIYALIFFAFKAPYVHRLQKWLIITSFGSLGVTIIFSLFYSFGNLLNNDIVSIDFMLCTHGFLNCLLFALLGVVGWSIFSPPSKLKERTFPISKIRGEMSIGGKLLNSIKDNQSKKSFNGLVDQMSIYETDIALHTLSPTIRDFYENTLNYRLDAEVKWKVWFKSFASVYRLLSSFVQQINLPLTSKIFEMTGNIIKIEEDLDGRISPRAWVRKMNGEIIFVAIYSWHRTNGRTYMNIALPLPWSSMVGILELSQIDNELQLSSKKSQSDDDTGIYLAWNNHLFALPIEETFHVKEIESGKLYAQHDMWLFSVPFLKITYHIHHHDLQQTK